MKDYVFLGQNMAAAFCSGAWQILNAKAAKLPLCPVPRSSVGFFIGKQGEYIKRIQVEATEAT
jgi:hypothetical protein